MEINKVVYGDKVLMDTTDVTVTPQTLAEGTTALDASGTKITGEMSTKTVLYEEQTLTEEQKAQARENIGVEKPIIDVLSLPETDINENVFYRVPVYKVYSGYRDASSIYTVHAVEGLPEVGEPVTTDMSAFVLYHNVLDDTVSGYVPDAMASQYGMVGGWYPAATIFQMANATFVGIVRSVDEIVDDNVGRVLLTSAIYSYKNGWHTEDNVGIAGTGSSSEVHNSIFNIASATHSHAEGFGTIASGDYSHAEGFCTTASNQASHAEGNTTEASGYASHAEGWETTASGERSHAEGSGTTASGDYSHAEGDHTTASDYFSHAEGSRTEASGSGSHAEGSYTTASGDYSHAEGCDTTASGNGSHAEGGWTTASGTYSHAEGYITTASSSYQHVQGKYNVDDPDGNYAHIVGNGTLGQTSNDDPNYSNAHTLDWDGNAWFAGDVYVGGTGQDDENATKLVKESDAIAAFNLKMDKNNPTGTGSFSMNRMIGSVIGNWSHTEGYYATASGNYSHAEGSLTVASGDSSHAEGQRATAEGSFSHAEGEDTTASGTSSHAEGSGTTASGERSHAEGTHTTASGGDSHAEGCWTIASGSNQHVQGKYNIEDTEEKYAHIVGNGTADDNRSNAHTLDWDGNGWFAGDVYVGGTGQDDENASKLVKETDIIPAIIDVATLPTENINENAFYRIPTYRTFFGINEVTENYTIHAVESLPEVGEPVTTDMSTYVFYHNVLDDTVSGYVPDAMGSQYGMAGGWYPAAAIFQMANSSFVGVFRSIDEVADNALSGGCCILLTKVLYSYTNGWRIEDKVGIAGTGHYSEIHNNTSNNIASGTYSHAEGSGTTASGERSHAEGSGTTASGEYSHAEGNITIASGDCSHAEGEGTKAEKSCSHAEGHDTTASGTSSHAEGYKTIASGGYSHTEGHSTEASGSCSHAEGASTTASGEHSHAEGYKTIASEMHSHAEGYETTASGSESHAEGQNTTASGLRSHAEGQSTIASGFASHAEGSVTTASGNSSHAEGSNTTASSDYQHVQGRYNIDDPDNKYAHIVGNGVSYSPDTGETIYSNAHTLDWDGNAWFAGDVYVGGTGQDDEAATKFARLPKTASITLTAANWSDTSPFTQTVEISIADANSKIDIQPDSTALAQMAADGIFSIYIANDNGVFTAYAMGAKPTADLTIQCCVTEVAP